MDGDDWRKEMETLRTIIVDEQPLFRQGLRSVLQRMGNCTLIGEATGAAEVCELVRTGQPDVALIADGLSSIDALELVRQLRDLAPRLAMIILTPSVDEERLFQSMRAGAAAYYTRAITADGLQEVIRKVSRGEYVIDADVLVKSQVASRVLPPSRKLAVEEEHAAAKVLHNLLTSREVEIVDGIAQGMGNKEIARVLKISDQTVKNHITSILKKLEVNDRTSAVVQALRHGLIKMHKPVS